MRCSRVMALGALVAVNVPACGSEKTEEAVRSTSAELIAWANGDFSQVLRVNSGQTTVANVCTLTIPLSQKKPFTFIAPGSPMPLLAWKGYATTNGTLSANGCPTYPCNVVASVSGSGPSQSTFACNIIADDGTSRLIGTSTGNALTVPAAPIDPVLFDQSVKIGAPNAKISGSCIFRQNEFLEAASVSNLTVSVNGTTEFKVLSAIPIGNVDWPTAGPTVPFGRLLVGSEIGATRLRHIAPRKEQLDEGTALKCGGSFSDGTSSVFDVNVTQVPAGAGVSLVRGQTEWVCGAATFGTLTGCNTGCGIIDPDCVCQTQTDCSPGEYCDAAGACVPKKPNGQSCGAHHECSSNGCPSGTCCTFGTSGFNQLALATGPNPSSVAIGDFNKDSRADVVVAVRGANNVLQFLNNGTGNLLAPTSYAAGIGPASIAIGDFNGDTNSDLVVANYAGNNISALLGTGGSFSPQSQFSAGTGPASVATGDFNSDGKLDVAVANLDSDNVSVLLRGASTFLAQSTYGTEDMPTSIVTANFNGDNHLDIAVTNYMDDSVTLLLGTGGTEGDAFSAQTIAAVGDGPIFVTAGDFDGDAVVDLALANYCDPAFLTFGCTTMTNAVTVLLGTGTGTFLSPQTYLVELGPQAIAVGDINKDGERDLVVAHASNKIQRLFGTGTGTFSIPSVALTFGTLNNPTSIAIGDFNGDTGEDVVLTNFGDGITPGATITVLYNQCGP